MHLSLTVFNTLKQFQDKLPVFKADKQTNSKSYPLMGRQNPLLLSKAAT